MNGIVIAILTQAVLFWGTSIVPMPLNAAEKSDNVDEVSTEIIQKSMKLNPGGLVLLDTQVGNITVNEYEGAEIRVELTIQGTPESIGAFRFTHNYFGNQLTVLGWCENNGTVVQCLKQIEFRVLIPKGAGFSVRVSTKKGDISALISDRVEKIDLATDAGIIRIALPSDYSALLDVSVSEFGTIHTGRKSVLRGPNINVDVDQEHHVKAKLNGGRSLITARSQIGNIFVDFLDVVKRAQS